MRHLQEWMTSSRRARTTAWVRLPMGRIALFHHLWSNCSCKSRARIRRRRLSQVWINQDELTPLNQLLIIIKTSNLWALGQNCNSIMNITKMLQDWIRPNKRCRRPRNWYLMTLRRTMRGLLRSISFKKGPITQSLIFTGLTRSATFPKWIHHLQGCQSWPGGKVSR